MGEQILCGTEKDSTYSGKESGKLERSFIIECGGKGVGNKERERQSVREENQTKMWVRRYLKGKEWKI